MSAAGILKEEGKHKMRKRPRTAAAKKRLQRIKTERRESKIKNLGIPVGAKSNKATR